MNKEKELKSIQTEYERLLKSSNPRKRGIDFEKVLAGILELEGLQPRTSYRPKGEEIDGSFFWSGQTFLLEAKWHKDSIPVSSIYSFKGKLDGKFHTTSGIFISMSGYGPETVDALRFGKAINIILFDKQDIDTILVDEVPFIEVLIFKLRQAGDTGNVLVPYSGKNVDAALSSVFNSTNESKVKKLSEYQLLIFVEGRSDINPITNLIKSLTSISKIDFEIVSLEGAGNIRRIPDYLSLYKSANYLLGTIVILDEDQNSESNLALIESIQEQIEHAAIGISNLFTFINEKEINALEPNNLLKENKRLSVFKKVNSFIEGLIYEFEYDPFTDIPNDAIVAAMEGVEWDFQNKRIITPSYELEPYLDKEIETLRDLVHYLDEAAIQAMCDQMSREWLDDEGMLDYTTEAQEYLIENYQKHIKKMGWTNADW